MEAPIVAAQSAVVLNDEEAVGIWVGESRDVAQDAVKTAADAEVVTGPAAGLAAGSAEEVVTIAELVGSFAGGEVAAAAGIAAQVVFVVAQVVMPVVAAVHAEVRNAGGGIADR